MKVFEILSNGIKVELVPVNKNGKVVYTLPQEHKLVKNTPLPGVTQKTVESTKLNLLKSFIKSVMSAQTLTEVSDELAELRLSSCRACPHFVFSQTTPDQHICDKCGCGERKILEIAIPKYHYLECPLGMPGFSNENKPWGKVKK
jgi:hypothetical protein